MSIWLDDLSRQRITSGGLERLIAERNVVGVTTNPTIFATALAEGEPTTTAARARRGRRRRRPAVFETTTDDSDAADIFRPVYDARRLRRPRVDRGRPRPRRTTPTRRSQRRTALWEKVDRPNVMIKIPATRRGPDAITAVIGAGISVNVTLIFSLDRYREVIDAYLAGLEQAKGAGIDLSTIHSVASFFVSRVDTEIDKRLTAIGTDEALALKSKGRRGERPTRVRAARAGVRGERASPSSTPAPTASGRCGVDWRQGPGAARHLYVTELVARRREHDAREDARGHVRPRRDRGRHGHRRLRRRRACARRARPSRRRLRRRHRVLEREGVEKFIVLARAARDRPPRWRRHDEPPHLRERPARRRGPPPVPQLVADDVASGITALDASLWGPEAEAEASKRLGWTEAVAVSVRCCPRSPPSATSSAPTASTTSCSRHGRLVARTRGHHPHREGPPHRARLDRAWPGRRGTRRPARAQRPRRRSPARPSRPTASAAPTSEASATPASTRRPASSS